MTYIKSSSITGGMQHESKLHLYMHQTFTGPNQNHTVVVNTGNHLSFGQMAVQEWIICEGRDPGSKVVARAHGMYAQCGRTKVQFDVTFNMVFEDDDSFNGSTLVVRGVTTASEGPLEWAIVGGTGQFTLAQGIVSGIRTNNATGCIIELSIHVFYRTIEKINNALEIEVR